MTLTGMQAAMAKAAVISMCSQAAVSFANNKFDPLKVAEDMFSKECLKKVALAAATAGITHELGEALNIEMDPEKLAEIGRDSFMEGLKAHAPSCFLQASVNGLAEVVVNGAELKDAIKNACLSGAASTVGAAGANRIGAAYKGENPSLNYFTHKVCHAVLGATLGALIGDDVKRGAVAGTIGAVVSEMISEAILTNADQAVTDIIEGAESQGKNLSAEDFKSLYNAKVQADTAADIGRLGASLVALLTKQDVTVAIYTATNAVQNNLIPAMIGVGLTAWEAYDLYKTATNQGVEAAVKQLGFDIVIASAGVYAGKRVYQLGKIVAPTAHEALQAYKQAHPVFAKFYDQAAAAIAKGVEKFKQFDAKLDAKVHQAWDKGKEKVSERFGKEQKVAPANPQNVAAHEKYKIELSKQEFESAERIGSALKSDKFHRSATFGMDSKDTWYKFDIHGGDGNPYKLFQKAGELDGRKGVFEYILTKDGKITHQCFISNKTVNGQPN
jgi:hypothetical protein